MRDKTKFTLLIWLALIAIAAYIIFGKMALEHFFPSIFIAPEHFTGSAGRAYGTLLGIGLFGPPILLAALILVPRQIFYTLQARKRLREGRCVYCGYDLRGPITRCPECGMMKPIYAPPRKK